MKNCEYYELAVSSLMDGELTVAEEAELREHMYACPSCRRLYEDMTLLSLDISELSATPPAELYDSIMDSLPRKAAPVKPIKYRRLWPSVAGAACLALIIGTVVIKNLPNWGISESAAMTMDAPAEAYAVTEEAAAIPETAMAEAEEPEVMAETAMADMADMATNGTTSGTGVFRDWTNPDTVPDGRGSDFEALLNDAANGSGNGSLHVFYAVEYRGVIYEFLTDGDETVLWWQDAAEGYPVQSTHTTDELWDIFA